MNTSFVPAVSVAVPELDSVETNCLLILKLVSLIPSLSVVNKVLTTSYGNLNNDLSFSGDCILVLCLLNILLVADVVPNPTAVSNLVLE